MSGQSRRVDLDSRALRFIEDELRGKPHDLAKFLCGRELAASKVYCIAASDCDSEELYDFRSGYGFKTAEDNEAVLATALLGRAAELVRPVLLLCSPFSAEQRSQIDLNFPSVASGRHVYWCADLTTQSQAAIAELLKFAGFTTGNIGVVTSAAEFSSSVCGCEISEVQLRRLADTAVMLMVSVYDGTNYLLCEF